MIEINSLKKCYGGKTVLDINSLRIEDGQSVAVIGPNGSGKSTLLKILAGIIKKYEGTVSVSDFVLYLPQQSIAFDKTVEKNILMGARGEKANTFSRLNELLSDLELDKLKDKRAGLLSGGELQRVALCRLLINDCSLLLLDEPTASADIRGAELIHGVIGKYLKDCGCSLIMSTHSPAEAKAVADRVIMLYDGKIIEDGSPEKLLESPTTEWGRKFISQWKI